MNKTEINWTTAGGSKIALILTRNAKLLENGYIPAATHDLDVQVNSKSLPLFDMIDHAQHGRVIRLDVSGKTLIKLPDEQRDAVEALVTEYRTHNNAVRAAEDRDDREYQARHDRIVDAMQGN